MHIFVNLTLAIALLSAPLPVGAVGANAAAPASDDIDQMEMKFFMHDYPQDTVDERLSRLEKLVFGEAKPGDTDERLTNLLMAMPANTPSPDPGSQASAPAQTASSQGATSDQGAGDTQDADDDDQTPADYPHVTALEQEILGHTFTNQPVTRRLDQLEVKAFGHPAGNPDLSDRVDRLEQYAEVKLHVAPFGQHPHTMTALGMDDSAPQAAYSHPHYPTTPPPDMASPPAAGATMQQKVSWMEYRVFGQVSSQQHLLERLEKLELALFPHAAPVPEMKLMDQVDKLMAQAKLVTPVGGAGTQPTAVAAAPADYDSDAGQQPDASQSPQRHPFLHSLEKALGSVGAISYGNSPYMMGGPIPMAGNGFGMGF